MRKVLILLAITIFLTSCKNEKKENIRTVDINEPKELVVKLGFKTNKEDRFRVLLNSIQVDPLQTKNIQIIEMVPPSTGFESIVAKFGPGNISNGLLITLGRIPKEVVFDGIEVSYGEQSLLITNGNFNKFFKINEYIEFNEKDFSFKTITIKNKSNPTISAKRALMNRLKKGK